MEFSLFPELIAILLYVEALEDNEVVFVENVRQFNRILTDSSKRPYLESLDQPKKVRNYWMGRRLLKHSIDRIRYTCLFFR